MPAAIIMREWYALAGYECAEHAMFVFVLQIVPVQGSASEPYLHCAGADVGRAHAGRWDYVVCGRSLPGAEADR